MSNPPRPSEVGANAQPVASSDSPRSSSRYAWAVVGLLWFCGFFNYADRQAVYSVFPLLETEFKVDNAQLAILGPAFMIVYALMSPFSGYAVDRLSRRMLIGVGLAFWSLVCAATALSRNLSQLVVFRALEGLGEAFYFPASMSVLAAYHTGRTRSRAMSIHQTSVYLGNAGGAALAGSMAGMYGWRSPFWFLGGIGIAYAVFLFAVLREPKVRASEHDLGSRDSLEPDQAEPGQNDRLSVKLGRLLRCPLALLLFCVFAGANSVATTFLNWLPKFIYDTFHYDIAQSSLISTAWPLASLVGCLSGGVIADWASRRSVGGRMIVQSAALMLAAPFVFLAGWSPTLSVVIIALIGAGLCKGFYDANIFAALYDVIPAKDRGTAAGVMNTAGWTIGAIVPYAVGVASTYYGMGGAIASTALIYAVVSVLAAIACRMTIVRARSAKLENSLTLEEPLA